MRKDPGSIRRSYGGVAKDFVSAGIRGRLSNRYRNNEPEVSVNLPEFRLLVKLYVPATLLITNNKVSLSQLEKYLPLLLDELLPQLNIEVHLLLASVVTNYVSSWYLLKLNTDNYAFVQAVYDALCHLVRDLYSRVLVLHSPDVLLELMGEAAAILDSHIEDYTLEEGVPHYARKTLAAGAGCVRATDMDLLKKQHLSQSHVAFDASLNGSSPRQVYLRVLARNILHTSFASCDDDPMSSDIVSSLLTAIVADLVLEKTLCKLSSPDFILSSVQSACDSSKTDKTRPEAPQSYATGIEDKLLLAQKILFAPRPSAHYQLIYGPIPKLVDRILKFSDQRSLLAHALRFCRTVAHASGIGQKIDSYITEKIFQTLFRLDSMRDSAVARKLELARRALFLNESGAKPKALDQKSEVVDKLHTILAEQVNKYRPVWRLAGFSQQDLAASRSSIAGFLDIFDISDAQEHASSDNNMLLMLRLLDEIVKFLYPELTETI